MPTNIDDKVDEYTISLNQIRSIKIIKDHFDYQSYHHDQDTIAKHVFINIEITNINNEKSIWFWRLGGDFSSVRFAEITTVNGEVDKGGLTTRKEVMIRDIKETIFLNNENGQNSDSIIGDDLDYDLECSPDESTAEAAGQNLDDNEEKSKKEKTKIALLINDREYNKFREICFDKEISIESIYNFELTRDLKEEKELSQFSGIVVTSLTGLVKDHIADDPDFGIKRLSDYVQKGGRIFFLLRPLYGYHNEKYPEVFEIFSGHEFIVGKGSGKGDVKFSMQGSSLCPLFSGEIGSHLIEKTHPKNAPCDYTGPFIGGYWILHKSIEILDTKTKISEASKKERIISCHMRFGHGEIWLVSDFTGHYGNDPVSYPSLLDDKIIDNFDNKKAAQDIVDWLSKGIELEPSPAVLPDFQKNRIAILADSGCFNKLREICFEENVSASAISVSELVHESNDKIDFAQFTGILVFSFERLFQEDTADIGTQKLMDYVKNGGKIFSLLRPLDGKYGEKFTAKFSIFCRHEFIVGKGKNSSKEDVEFSIQGSSLCPLFSGTVGSVLTKPNSQMVCTGPFIGGYWVLNKSIETLNKKSITSQESGEDRLVACQMKFGHGEIWLVSDFTSHYGNTPIAYYPSLFDDKIIDKYDNKEAARNIVGWLST